MNFKITAFFMKRAPKLFARCVSGGLLTWQAEIRELAPSAPDADGVQWKRFEPTGNVSTHISAFYRAESIQGVS